MAPSADLRIQGRFFGPDGHLRTGVLRVLNGKVLDREDGPAARTLDAGESVIVPGAIDPHVHFRDPGHPEKEDFASGTKAAALGGVTTVLDMPNTSPPTFTREALADKLARAHAKACVDFGLHLGLDAKGESLALLPEASSMKIYLGATTGDLLVRDMALVRRALLAAAQAKRTVVVHAESQDCLDRHAHLASDTYASHAEARPPTCEAEAIRDLTRASAGAGTRVHVAHLSTAAGLAAMSGTSMTAEVCPHHLLLTKDRLTSGPFKMNPPLRAYDDVRTLWQALADGRIACLASDHAPHTPQEKSAAKQGACPAGVPGVQTLVPLLIPQAAKHHLPLARLFAASTAGARVFHLPNKGDLAIGSDADIAVYDLARETTVRASAMASKAGWTPFEGMPAVFPTHVFSRGLAVVEDGRFVGRAGTGRFVRPSPG